PPGDAEVILAQPTEQRPQSLEAELGRGLDGVGQRDRVAVDLVETTQIVGVGGWRPAGDLLGRRQRGALAVDADEQMVAAEDEPGNRGMRSAEWTQAGDERHLPSSVRLNAPATSGPSRRNVASLPFISSSYCRRHAAVPTLSVLKVLAVPVLI